MYPSLLFWNYQILTLLFLPLTDILRLLKIYDLQNNNFFFYLNVTYLCLHTLLVDSVGPCDNDDSLSDDDDPSLFSILVTINDLRYSLELRFNVSSCSSILCIWCWHLFNEWYVSVVNDWCPGLPLDGGRDLQSVIFSQYWKQSSLHKDNSIYLNIICI